MDKQQMVVLLESLVVGLVEKPDDIVITADEPNEDNIVVFHLSVAEGDMGRVIGKGGRIAKAIRIIMRSVASKSGQKIAVDID